MKYGLIIPEINTEEEGINYILGSSKLKGEVINPSGDWRPYLPDREPQNKNGVETQTCTAYATLSALEALLKFKGYNVNYSDRYLAIVGKIDPYKGVDPHTIAEVIRNISGCLREDKLPFSDDIKTPEDYYNVPQNIIAQLLKEGQQWYNEWEFNHEWVFKSGKPNEKRLLLQEALTKGTVCVSVSAWFRNEKGLYYKPEGMNDNHWVLLSAEPPLKTFIFDSYDNYEKELDGLYDFSIAKVYYLTPAQQKLNWLQEILNLIAKIIGLQAIFVQEIVKKNETMETPKIEEPKIEKYLWDNPRNVRHSVRVICDEEGLSVAEKNSICAIINCESGHDIKRININKNGSKDLGLIQANDYWYIKKGKFLTEDQALNDPEFCVRLMIKRYKQGFLKDWICYRDGLYKKFL